MYFSLQAAEQDIEKPKNVTASQRALGRICQAAKDAIIMGNW